MNIKKIGKALICFLLICCVLLNSIPVQTEASAIAATLVGAATAKVSADILIPAIVIAIGVAAGTNDDFQNLCSDAASALSGWIQDGYVEVIRTVDSLGNQAFYAAGQMMEDLRSWIFDSEYVSESLATSHSYSYMGYPCMYADFPFGAAIFFSENCYYRMVYSKTPGTVNIDTNFDASSVATTITLGGSSYNGIYYHCSYGSISDWQSVASSYLGVPVLGTFPIDEMIKFGNVNNGPPRYVIANCSLSFHSSYGLSLGYLPSTDTNLTDGTSARAWSEDMTDNGLYVVGGSNDPDPPDENNGKWFWPIALALTAADLIAMSQSDQWSGITPGEFDNYEESQSYYITPVEVSFGQGIEISPVTNPDTGGDTGGDTGEDTETEPDTGGEVQTDYTTWFSKIVTSLDNITGHIDEIPNRFQGWITDCKTSVEELPSKFADWFADIKTGIQELPSKFSNWLDRIIELLQNILNFLQNLVASLINALRQLLTELFSPSEDFLQEKAQNLTAKYPYIDTFNGLGNQLKNFFLNLGTKPPSIYIDLGAAAGSYYLGGREVFIDLTWYSQYKSTVDTIIGGFLWLWLAWRIFISLPDIIHGGAGTWGQPKNDIGMLPTQVIHKELPPGKRSRR